MNKLFQVIRKELREIAMTKAFIILTLTGPLLILAVSILPSLLSRNSMMESGKNKTIAIICQEDSELDAITKAFATQEITIKKETNLEDMKTLVRSGQYDGVLMLTGKIQNNQPISFYIKGSTNIILREKIKGILNSLRISYLTGNVTNQLTLAGVKEPGALLEEFNKEVNFATFDLNATEENSAVNDSDFTSMIFVALGFMMMIYMTALLYGQMIGRSVVVEKTTKTVEIILSSVTPRDLMFGKILGIALAGLIQYAVWASVSIVLIAFVGPFIGLSLPAGLTVINVIYLVIFFVLAFLLYGSVYAALGAASEDEQNLGQMAWPVIILLMIPMITFMQFITNPDGPISVALSLFPFTAPEVMLMRLLVSPVPVWQIALCIGILLISILLVGIFAAKVFRIGILLSGKKFKLGEVVGWITQKE